MIVFDDVTARSSGGKGRAASVVRGARFTAGPGLMTIVGAVHDGTAAILDAAAGNVRVRRGRITIDGDPPSLARPRVAFVPFDATLPDALRVDEAVDLAATLRGEPSRPVGERLGILGLEALRTRHVRSLTVAEARGVTMAIALTGTAKVILVEEPMANLDASAVSRMTEALRDRAAAGTTILVTTASVRDAARLSDSFAVVTGGVLTTVDGNALHVGRKGVRLRVVVAGGDAEGVARFAAGLREDPAVTGVETTSFAEAGTTVTASGRDWVALASAVGRNAASSGVHVQTIESSVEPVDAIRALLAASAPPLAMPIPVTPPEPPSQEPPTGVEPS